MKQLNIDWTHKDMIISDVRKLHKLYVIKVVDSTLSKNQARVNAPLFVKDTIFEERLKSYFFKDITNIIREDILGVKWNMYITKGYFIKIDENGVIQKFNNDPDKWYISYLEIEGPLAEFGSIYKYIENKTIKQLK